MEVEYAGVEVCVGNLILGGKALNLKAVIAKVFLPFRSPHLDADARTVQMQLLFEGIGTRPGITVAEQAKVAVRGMVNDGTHELL